MARKKRSTADLSETPPPDNTVNEDLDGLDAGQSGDLQGLPDDAEADSQSVRELVAEGQAFEAAVVDAIENAPPPDVAEVKTKEVPEDDVPPEYTDKDPDQPKEE